MPDLPGLERLRLALNPIGAQFDGPHRILISGTVNTIGGGTGGTAMVDNNPFTPGGTSITPVGGYYGGRSVSSGNAAAFSIDQSGNLQVNVVAGGAGGGVANLSVRGSANTDLHVGYASGAGVNQDGGAYVPILGTVNLGAGAAPFASVAVYGSPAMPVYNIGSVNVVNPVGIFGSLGAGSLNVLAGQAGAPWSVVGSQGVTQLGAPWSFVGSAGVTPLATFTVALDKIPTVNLGLGTVNIGNIPTVLVGSIPAGSLNVLAGQAGAPWSVVGSVNAVMGTLPMPIVGSINATPLGVQVTDPRASLTATQWIISFGGSGQTVVAGSAPASQRVYFSSYHLVATGTIDMQWQSPSGVAISGSFRVLPGAGFAFAGAMPNSPVLIGSQQSPVALLATGTQNVGGVAIGWVGP